MGSLEIRWIGVYLARRMRASTNCDATERDFSNIGSTKPNLDSKSEQPSLVQKDFPQMNTDGAGEELHLCSSMEKICPNLF
jgi:hypothetical protein